MRFWSSFESKAAFDVWYTDDAKVKLKVVAEGISTEECVRLIRMTPMEAYLAAAIQDSTDGSGVIHAEHLVMKLAGIAFASAYHN